MTTFPGWNASGTSRASRVWIDSRRAGRRAAGRRASGERRSMVFGSGEVRGSVEGGTGMADPDPGESGERQQYKMPASGGRDYLNIGPKSEKDSPALNDRGSVRRASGLLALQPSEDRGANTHERGPLLDGDLEVAGHAHRQVLQLMAHDQPLLPEPVAKLSQLLECQASLFRVVRVGGHAHEPGDVAGPVLKLR